MLSKKTSIKKIVESIYSSSTPPLPKSLTLKTNPFTKNTDSTRPNSAVIEDSAFGDSGKGVAVQLINNLLSKSHKSGIVYSYCWGGSRNAGHEVTQNGQAIALHQLPEVVTHKGGYGIIGRGTLLHPEDLITEIDYAKKKLGGSLWGQLIIDPNVTIATNLHSAYEFFTLQQLSAGKGSTGYGIAQGYGAFYEKRALTLYDFLEDRWEERFSKEYRFYQNLISPLSLSDIEVNMLTKEGKRVKKRVGTEKEFLESLKVSRAFIKKEKYPAEDIQGLLTHVWKETTTPMTFEGRQGPGLDPFHGPYPDVTSSRTLARVGIPDSTAGIVMAEEIAARCAVTKIPYMSIVGSKIPPYVMNADIAAKYRDENDERGKSTGRDRGIYPIDLVAMQYYQRVSGYEYQVITHLDAARKDRPIEIVVEYQQKDNHQPIAYYPSQRHWNEVHGVVVQLPSWDGERVKNAKTIADLPGECLQFLKLLSETLAPVAIAKNGALLENQILFF